MILRWLGFRTTSIDLPRADRYAGASSYSFGMLLRFALDGLFFQTTIAAPLDRLRGLRDLGGSGTILAAFFVVNYFAGDRTRAGRASASCSCWWRLHHRQHGCHRPLRRQDLRAGQGPAAVRRGSARGAPGRWCPCRRLGHRRGHAGRLRLVEPEVDDRVERRRPETEALVEALRRDVPRLRRHATPAPCRPPTAACTSRAAIPFPREPDRRRRDRPRGHPVPCACRRSLRGLRSGPRRRHRAGNGAARSVHRLDGPRGKRGSALKRLGRESRRACGTSRVRSSDVPHGHRG